MNDEQHYRGLERLYLSAPCNEYYRPKLTITRGEACLQIDIRPEFFHAAGATHGSVYFKAMDDAGFFAVNSLVREVFVLTVSFNIQLLRPISDGSMTAVGKAHFSSRNLYAADTLLRDDRGREIGRGSGLYVPSRIRLADLPAYSGR